MSREMQLARGDVDFSRVNLQYLISARDLARGYPERAAVLLGVPDALGQLLAELSAESLTAVVAIKAPLLIPSPPGVLVVGASVHRAAGRSSRGASVRPRAGGSAGRHRWAIRVGAMSGTADQAARREGSAGPGAANACDADLCLQTRASQ